jgi:hypothetical protein
MTEKILIVDARLTPDMIRIRSGRKQEFHDPNNRSHPSEGADVTLIPPRPELYAENIDGQWYWVNGCAECNGKPRDCWMSYIECETHNVCRTCKTPRKALTAIPWAGKHGWQCQPCADAEREATKAERLAAIAAEDYDESDYENLNEIKCPHCGTAYEPDGEVYDRSVDECEICGGQYSVEVEYTVTYSTKVIGERLKP